MGRKSRLKAEKKKVNPPVPTDWSKIPWTEFVEVNPPTHPLDAVDPCDATFVNSRYQVSVYYQQMGPPFGLGAHLSFKVHDRAPHHDFRDMQRIKNEICGEDCDAVEVYPAESKLVDSANQYHLFVFKDYKLPFGFQERLVGDGDWEKSKQRPWPPGERPADCMSPEDYDKRIQALIEKRKHA